MNEIITNTQTDDKNVQTQSTEKQKINRSFLNNIGATKEKTEEDVPLWLITFTDVMALMLTFFVLLYSMSVPDVEKWEELSTAVNQGLSKFQSANFSAGSIDRINIDKIAVNKALSLDYLRPLIEKSIAKSERLKGLIIIPQNDRLILSLPADLLFKGGEAEVSIEGKRALFALGETLARIKNRVEIIGHADPRPIQGGTYNNNWALSLARAASVSSALDDVGYNKPSIVRGLSSGRYEDLPDNMAEDDRLKFSRRVDVVIMEDDGTRSNIISGNVF